MSKALIVSVGGSIEPIIASLREYAPAYVCFFVSQQSVDMVPEIKQNLDISFEDYKVIADNPEDLMCCYGKAAKCWDFLESKGVSPKDVIVDYTGGTKVMSAALVLLAVSKGLELSYVGGTQRNKGGLGTVIKGHERVFGHENPWEIMAIDERKRAATLFNKHQFEAAHENLKSAIGKVRMRALRHYLEALKVLCEGYLLWDKFAHKKAVAVLRRGLDKLSEYAAIAGDSQAATLAGVVEKNLEFLKALGAASDDFTKPCREHLLDLLANAQRRGKEGKYDDAVARLYRSLELLAQLRLERTYGIKSGNVDHTKVPQGISEKLRQRYSDPADGKIKIGLKAAFDLLFELGDDLGGRYRECKDIEGVLSARNNSILAHGLQPVGQDTFDRMWGLVLQFSQVKESELPTFPELSLE